eukprot:8471357-Alexandrium_andersonii.AAC.1
MSSRLSTPQVVALARAGLHTVAIHGRSGGARNCMKVHKWLWPRPSPFKGRREREQGCSQEQTQLGERCMHRRDPATFGSADEPSP